MASESPTDCIQAHVRVSKKASKHGFIVGIQPSVCLRRDSRTPTSCSVQGLLGRELDDSPTMKVHIPRRPVAHYASIYKR